MDLILWRHAEAEDTVPDALRKLTPKGKKQAAKVAAWLKKRMNGPVTVLSSPATRARETAEALGGDVRFDAGLGVGASPAVVLRIAGWPDGEGTVVVAGHQPTLGMAAARALAGREESWNVKKGAAWWLRAKVHGGGELEVVLVAVIGPDMV
jgi:phosphohistidine phosphatase